MSEQKNSGPAVGTGLVVNALFLAISLLFFLFGFQEMAMALPTSGLPEPKIRVLVGKDLKTITLHGIELERIYPGEKRIRRSQKSKTVKFDCRKRKMIKGQGKTLVKVWSRKKNLIRWGKSVFPGRLDILKGDRKDRCHLVSELSLDKYISFLLAKEMHRNWPIEALKAQAIAARTYALSKMINNPDNETRGYHLENSEKDQVNGSLLDENLNTRQAALSTKNIVLLPSNGQLYPVFYHSKCGGKTMRPEEVWGGRRIPGYQSVNCPYCHKHGMRPWKKYFNQSGLQKILASALKRHSQNFSTLGNHKAQAVITDRVSSRHSGLQKYKVPTDHFNRNRLYVSTGKGAVFLPKSSIRKASGRKSIPSHRFKVQKTKSGWLVQGVGHGHGVGLCQYGAYEMANRGFMFQDILKHYFPSHQLIDISQSESRSSYNSSTKSRKKIQISESSS